MSTIAEQFALRAIARRDRHRLTRRLKGIKSRATRLPHDWPTWQGGRVHACPDCGFVMGYRAPCELRTRGGLGPRCPRCTVKGPRPGKRSTQRPRALIQTIAHRCPDCGIYRGLRSPARMELNGGLGPRCPDCTARWKRRPIHGRCPDCGVGLCYRQKSKIGLGRCPSCACRHSHRIHPRPAKLHACPDCGLVLGYRKPTEMTVNGGRGPRCRPCYTLQTGYP